MISKKSMKKLLPIAVLSSLAFGSMIGTQQPSIEAKGPKHEEKAGSKHKNNAEIKNVIVLIGDGMGVSYTSAYRYLKDDPTTKVKERTAYDPYLVGQQMTYPEDPEQNVTDSASAATAMSAGIKTYNNAIGVDNDGSEVKTVLEAAKEKGKATGLVATSEITHATPASFGSHDHSRKNMDSIADDYFDEMIKGEHKVDVLLGGGKSNFIRNDRNLVEEFKKDGYAYVDSKKEMLNNKDDQILGLFADGGLPKMIDREKETPSLEEMTNTALKKLNKDKDGFFLMVEGSQIDWAGHDNDIVGAMSEMEDFEKAFEAAIEFAKKDKHTLVVATADHSTGGYSIGADGIYNWFSEPIKAAKRTPDFMAEEIANGANVEETLKKYIDQEKLPLTAEEIQSVEKAAKTKKSLEIDNAIETIFNKRSHTGWTTGGHTGEDVPVYAFGPASEAFAGQINNTDIAKNVFDALNYKIEINDK
jgi:alkaline phosphatase